MGRLIPLKNSKYVDALCQKIDKWKQKPHNRQLLSPVDDKPMLAFSDNRAENFNEALGAVFRYDYYPHDLTSRDFVCVDANDEVVGYFHCLIAELPGGTNSVSGLRTYRFGGTPYLYGRAQAEFYQWLYESFDIVTMIAIANSDFADGKVTIKGEPVSEEMSAIFERNKELTGFAQPGGFKLVQKYNGRFDPYVGFVHDMDGIIRFFHIFRWLGARGPSKGLTINPIVHDPKLVEILEENGIFVNKS